MLCPLSSRNNHVCLFSSAKESVEDTSKKSSPEDDRYNHQKVSAFQGHSFPDFIEKWNRNTFRKVGYGLVGLTGAAAALPLASGVPLAEVVFYAPSALLAVLTASYWRVGLSDIKQTQHAIRRNYPVLGNMRYILETIRPEIRQVSKP